MGPSIPKVSRVSGTTQFLDVRHCLTSLLLHTVRLHSQGIDEVRVLGDVVDQGIDQSLVALTDGSLLGRPQLVLEGATCSNSL